MSMNEQFTQMKNFESNIRAFNEQLNSSLNELQDQHDNVSPHWQDDMRKQYDSVWEPFHAKMKHYVKSEGPGYVEFLNIKIHTLARYLYGD